MSAGSDPISLGDLAFACYIYEAMTGFDVSIAEFRAQVNNNLDLGNAEHRQALLHWLNHRGCRHLATADHDRASASLASWQAAHQDRLPSPDARLVDMDDPELDAFAGVFDALRSLDAARTKRGRRSFKVSFGPTASAKTLFALRPHVFVAWDDAIREGLEHDGSGASYLQFLKSVRGRLREVREPCTPYSLTLETLPPAVDRPHSTAAELIDEYCWMTLTRGVEPPAAATLRKWLEWGPKS